MDEHSSLHAWMSSAGLGHLTGHFVSHGVSEESFPQLSLGDFDRLGVSEQAARQRLFRLVQVVRSEQERERERELMLANSITHKHDKQRDAAVATLLAAPGHGGHSGLSFLARGEPAAVTNGVAARASPSSTPQRALSSQIIRSEREYLTLPLKREFFLSPPRSFGEDSPPATPSSRAAASSFQARPMSPEGRSLLTNLSNGSGPTARHAWAAPAATSAASASTALFVPTAVVLSPRSSEYVAAQAAFHARSFPSSPARPSAAHAYNPKPSAFACVEATPTHSPSHSPPRVTVPTHSAHSPISPKSSLALHSAHAALERERERTRFQMRERERAEPLARQPSEEKAASPSFAASAYHARDLARANASASPPHHRTLFQEREAESSAAASSSASAFPAPSPFAARPPQRGSVNSFATLHPLEPADFLADDDLDVSADDSDDGEAEDGPLEDEIEGLSAQPKANTRASLTNLPTSKIRVAVRKRPLNARERSRGESDVVQVQAPSSLTVFEPKTRVDLTRFEAEHRFHFDATFEETATNEEIYGVTCSSLVDFVMEGRGGRATCFAYGQTGAGKCWGRDTKLIMFDGSTKKVQDIKEGDELMGDDGQVRTVLPGSVIAGHTGADVAKFAQSPVKRSSLSADLDSQRPLSRRRREGTQGPARIENQKRRVINPIAGPAMYRITLDHDGRDSFTCNGDHILVVKFHQRPTEVRKLKDSRRRQPFFYSQWGLIEGSPMQRTFSFATRQEADAAREAAFSAWEPLEWQGSIDAFHRLPPHTQQVATMFRPDRVLPFAPSKRSLQTRLVSLFGRAVSTAEVVQTAWVLGLWLCDGDRHGHVSQIGLNKKRPSHSHTPVILELERWYATMHGVPVTSGVSADDNLRSEFEDKAGTQITKFAQTTTAGNSCYQVNLGRVFQSLLASYDLTEDKHVPLELLREGGAIRRALLAGVIDGDGWLNKNHMFEVSGKDRRFIDDLVSLARGLGLAVGKADKARCEAENGDEYHGFRILIGGRSRGDIETVLQHKRAHLKAETRDPLCDRFTIKKLQHAEYFGFQLGGVNGRCLLSSFVVTHNTHTLIGPEGGKGEQRGLYVLAARDIFATLQRRQREEQAVGAIGAGPVSQTKFVHCAIFLSYYELYSGKLFDLLHTRSKLVCRADAAGVVHVVGLRERKCKDVGELMQLIAEGNKERSTGVTGANIDSSRSHAILSISLRQIVPTTADGRGAPSDKKFKLKTRGAFSFIDLAGSERAADTSNNDRRTRLEGAEINKSLLALKECIRALDQGQLHTPFRGSILTQVLKSSFVGNSRTVMVANIAPNSASAEHTLNSLRYADRVKQLRKAATATVSSAIPTLAIPANGPSANGGKSARSGAGADAYMPHQGSARNVKITRVSPAAADRSSDTPATSSATTNSPQRAPNSRTSLRASSSMQQLSSPARPTRSATAVRSSIAPRETNSVAPPPAIATAVPLPAGDSSSLHHDLCARILSEENELVARHRTSIDVRMQALKSEMALLRNFDSLECTVDDYILQLDDLLHANGNGVSALRSRIRTFDGHLREEEKLSAQLKRG